MALAAAFLLTAPAVLDAQERASGEVEEAILEMHEAMREAAEAGDADELFDFVLDSAVPPIIEDGRVLSTRSEALRSTTDALRGLESVSYDYGRRDITMLSPTVVLWVAEGTGTAVLADGRRVSAPFAETMVLVRRDGEWKVLHAHRSSIRR